MSYYEPKDIADILFQEKDRITAGLLTQEELKNGITTPELDKKLGRKFREIRAQQNDEGSLAQAIDELALMDISPRIIGQIFVEDLLKIAKEKFDECIDIVEEEMGRKPERSYGEYDLSFSYHLGIKAKYEKDDPEFWTRHREFFKVDVYEGLYNKLRRYYDNYMHTTVFQVPNDENDTFGNDPNWEWDFYLE